MELMGLYKAEEYPATFTVGGDTGLRTLVSLSLCLADCT